MHCLKSCSLALGILTTPDWMPMVQRKIAIEGGRNSGYLIRRYELWKKGTIPLEASEIDQIAVRLMGRFELDTLYVVDAYPLLLELRDERS